MEPGTVLHMMSITGEPWLCALFLQANADPNIAGAFEQKLQFYFIFHFTDWADGVAYGVNHWRTPVVCPISSSQCRSQSDR